MIEPWRHRVWFHCDPLTLLSVGSTVAGTVLSAAGASQQGKAQAAALETQAMQAERAANEKRAQASLEAAQKFKEESIVLSNQQAAAGASGGGATDPTLLDLAGDVAAYGYQQRGIIKANGENQARGYDDEAIARRADAKSARSAGTANAFGSILGGMSAAARNYHDLMPKPK